MKQIRLFKPYVSPQARANVQRVLSGTQLAEGPEVKAFEKEFSEKFNLKHVAAVNSGTSSLELAFELAGVGSGDEVITPVLTCTATNLPILHRGAKIVFADVDDDLNISIVDVERKITPKTKALVFVHFGGNNRGLKEMVRLGKKYAIPVIEDAAQAVGSDYWGKADFVCVSLQAIKTLTSGDGGFVICKRKADYERAKRLRWFGYDRDLKQKLGDTDLIEAGYKYHMNDITAAIGRGNLSVIDRLVTHRKKLIARYNKHPNVHAHAWMAIVTGIPSNTGVMQYLAEHGVGTGQYHYRNDKYTVFGGRKRFPRMDEMENSYFLLPLHHDVSLKDVDYILSVLDRWISAH